MVLKAGESVHDSTNVKCLVSVLVSILFKCSLNQDFSVRVLTVPKFTVSVQLSALPKHRPKIPISVKKSAEQIFVSFPCDRRINAVHESTPVRRGRAKALTEHFGCL
jgi:hypothetical protein